MFCLSDECENGSITCLFILWEKSPAIKILVYDGSGLVLLAKRIVDHHLSSEELTEESALRRLDNPSDSQWMETGLYDKCTKIQIIERSYIKEIHRKHKYKLRPEFNQSEKEVLITSKGPSELLPGMNCTTEFVSSVVADKFGDYSGPAMTDGYKS